MTSFRWIPWLIAATFIPVLAINGVLVQQALHSSTGLVSDRSFDTGQDYNRIIAVGKKQEALGWKTDVTLTPGENRHRAWVAVSVRDFSGERLRGLTVVGRLYSPVDPQPDQNLALTEGEDGLYRQELDLPRAGQWDAQLMAKRGEESFAIDQRLVLR
jgi:nitrogen fixation protein FixH